MSLLYKRGRCVSLTKSAIILDTPEGGYSIHVPNVSQFKDDLNKSINVYVQEQEVSGFKQTFGFKTIEERNVFGDLVQINGIGSRTAMKLLKDGSQPLMNAVANKDHNSIYAIEPIKDRVADQLILDLSRKYESILAQQNEASDQTQNTNDDIVTSEGETQ